MLAAASAGDASGAGGAAAAAARAQAFERGNDYARAIEAYLAPSGAGAAGAELDALQRCWEAALALAARHQVCRLSALFCKGATGWKGQWLALIAALGNQEGVRAW